MEKKIQSIQGLRFVAFLLVFLDHAGSYVFTMGGECGVSLFIMLSGFLLEYRHNKESKKKSLSMNVKFTWNKIKRLYPLHIFTMFLFVPFLFLGDVKESILLIITKVAINIFLLQTWLPLPQLAINSVSWYLCVACFFWFSFYFFHQIIREKNKKSILRYIFLCLIIQVALAYFFSKRDVYYYKNIMIYPYWIIYYHPLSRILDFIMGLCLGALYANRNKTVIQLETSRKIVLFTIIIFVIDYIMAFVFHMVFSGNSFLQNISGVAVFSIGNMLLLYVVSCENNALASFFNKTIFVYLGNLSPYMYLLHFLVFEYAGRIIWRYLGESAYVKYGFAVKVTVGFAVTLMLSHLYSIIVKYSSGVRKDRLIK